MVNNYYPKSVFTDIQILLKKASPLITSENNFIETITVFDLTGNQVKMLYPNSKNATIDLSELISGMYIAKYSTKAGTGNIRFAVN
jgi:hypothetical protein